MNRIEIGGGVELQLLAGKAAWWPAERTLLVADAHIGKAVSFRRLGVPVPEATNAWLSAELLVQVPMKIVSLPA